MKLTQTARGRVTTLTAASAVIALGTVLLAGPASAEDMPPGDTSTQAMEQPAGPTAEEAPSADSSPAAEESRPDLEQPAEAPSEDVPADSSPAQDRAESPATTNLSTPVQTAEAAPVDPTTDAVPAAADAPAEPGAAANEDRYPDLITGHSTVETATADLGSSLSVGGITADLASPALNVVSWVFLPSGTNFADALPGGPHPVGLAFDAVGDDGAPLVLFYESTNTLRVVSGTTLSARTSVSLPALKVVADEGVTDAALTWRIGWLTDDLVTALPFNMVDIAVPMHWSAPATPDEPALPDTPATPDEPALPDTPATPDEPDTTDAPGAESNFASEAPAAYVAALPVPSLKPSSLEHGADRNSIDTTSLPQKSATGLAAPTDLAVLAHTGSETASLATISGLFIAAGGAALAAAKRRRSSRDA